MEQKTIILYLTFKNNNQDSFCKNLTQKLKEMKAPEMKMRLKCNPSLTTTQYASSSVVPPFLMSRKPKEESR